MGTGEPKTLAQVFEQMQNQVDLLERLKESVNGLEDKLTCVTTPSAMAKESEKPPEQKLVPLASDIRENNLILSCLIDHLIEMRQRIEL